MSGSWIIAALALHPMLWVGIANQMRAVYRRHAVRAAFGPDGGPLPSAATLWVDDRWLTWAVMMVNLALLLSAALGRTIALARHPLPHDRPATGATPRPGAALKQSPGNVSGAPFLYILPAPSRVGPRHAHRSTRPPPPAPPPTRSPNTPTATSGWTAPFTLATRRQSLRLRPWPALRRRRLRGHP